MFNQGVPAIMGAIGVALKFYQDYKLDMPVPLCRPSSLLPSLQPSLREILSYSVRAGFRLVESCICVLLNSMKCKTSPHESDKS